MGARGAVIPLKADVLLMLAACTVVRTVAMHVVYERSGPRVAVGSISSFFVVRCVCVASVLVAMAERAMDGVLGAGGAPSASCLQAPWSAGAVFSGFVHTLRPIVGSWPTCRCTNSIPVTT